MPNRHRRLGKPGLNQEEDKNEEEFWGPSITARESAMRSVALTSEAKPKENLETLVVSQKEEVKFKTGSRYKGGWNSLGMAGTGEYKIFHGVTYDGSLDDGKFHGKGIMWYPNNSRVEGVWDKGHHTQRKYYFNDGLAFDEKNWSYCKYPDRRFQKEIKPGIRATGRTLMSNRIPPRPIPPGCYDVGDGFYSPITKCVTHPETGRILRIPPRSEEKWILENCRKSSGLNMFVQPNILIPRFSTDDTEKDDEEETIVRVKDESLAPAPGLGVPGVETKVEFEEPKMVDKSTGRFELLYKRVDHRAYNSKYIFLDEIRNRACKKHRLYLPALKLKTKVHIIPDLRVIPPFRCVHESKAVLSNKMVLLLKMLKECEKEGGIRSVEADTLERYKKEFQELLAAERLAKDHGAYDSVSSIISAARNLSYQLQIESKDPADGGDISTQKETKVFAFKEGDPKRSILSVTEHKALRAKELATMASETSSFDSAISPVVARPLSKEPYNVPDQSTKNELVNKECDVCLREEKDIARESERKFKIQQMISESEEAEKRIQRENAAYILIEKIIEQIAKDEIAPFVVTNVDGKQILVRRCLESEEAVKDSINNLTVEREENTEEEGEEEEEEEERQEVEEGEEEEAEKEREIGKVEGLIEGKGDIRQESPFRNEDVILNASVGKTDFIMDDKKQDGIDETFSELYSDERDMQCQESTGVENETTEENPPKSEKENIFQGDSPNVQEKNETATNSDTKLNFDLSDITDVSDIETSEWSASTPSRPVTPLSDLSPIESDYGDHESEGY